MSEGLIINCVCGGRAARISGHSYAIYQCASCGYEIHMKHCWNCRASINNQKDSRCENCGWNICSECGACSPNCVEKNEPERAVTL